mmetsp:Transcript_20894/g.53149  ORF Transcript_20894/g.53149 Transcript_20894/m.53149 type:complete len:210 (+) Transcript_20894:539-1168(+)
MGIMLCVREYCAHTVKLGRLTESICALASTVSQQYVGRTMLGFMKLGPNLDAGLRLAQANSPASRSNAFHTNVRPWMDTNMANLDSWICCGRGAPVSGSFCHTMAGLRGSLTFTANANHSLAGSPMPEGSARSTAAMPYSTPLWMAGVGRMVVFKRPALAFTGIVIWDSFLPEADRRVRVSAAVPLSVTATRPVLAGETDVTWEPGGNA